VAPNLGVLSPAALTRVLGQICPPPREDPLSEEGMTAVAIMLYRMAWEHRDDALRNPAFMAAEVLRTMVPDRLVWKAWRQLAKAAEQERTQSTWLWDEDQDVAGEPQG
jgi:hypothetical protein